MDALESRVVPTGTPAWAAGAAPGGEPRVWVYDSAGQQVTSFLAFEPEFTGGVRVTVADLNADGTPDIVTAAGPGGGPRVRTFDGATGDTLADFMAYDSDFTGGVWVAAGPVGGGANGIATGADAGGGPRVRVFAADGAGLQDFFAYDTTFTGGVRVALGNAGKGPIVYAASGAEMPPTARGYSVANGAKLFDRSAGGDGTTGTLIATGDVNGDGADDVFTATANGSDTELRAFSGASGIQVGAAAISGSADGLTVLNWGGQKAIAVLGGGSLTAYQLAGSGQPPTQIGQMSSSDWGGSGSTAGGIPVGGSAWSGYGAVLETLTQTYPFPNPPSDTVTVTSTVIADSPDYPGRFLWEYRVHNDSFDATASPPFGAGTFVVQTSMVQAVSNIGNSLGWNSSTEDPWLEGPAVLWGTPDDDHDIPVGGDGYFWFTTPPLPIVHSLGEVLDRWVANTAGGEALAPDEPPKIIITYADGTEVTQDKGLKVAKWQDAFVLNAFEDPVVRDPDSDGTDFIDRDPDRFNVRVYDKHAFEAGQQYVDAKISTKNVQGFQDYDDPPTTVRLVRDPTRGDGWYWTDSEMLVSNKVDDEYSGPQLGADESGPIAYPMYFKHGQMFPLTDRTHRIALRGTVKAEYTVGGMTVAASAEVKPTKVVKVHGIILRDKAQANGGQEVIAKATAEAAIQRANEQYAQVGILLIPNCEIKDPPNDNLLQNGLDVYMSVTDGRPDMTTEEQTLLGDASLRTAATDDVELYFVNFFSQGDRGESFWASGVSDEKYADSAIISSRDRRPFTIPHEIGHLLLNSGEHYRAGIYQVNLMRVRTSDADAVEASKRLTPGQETDMLGGPNNVPPPKRGNLLT